MVKKSRDALLLNSKCVFKLKTHADGSIERFKARMVASGDQQGYGANYTYTFSAVQNSMCDRSILVVARKWSVLARHGAFVKADKEAEVDILLHIPMGMEVSQALLKLLGVTYKWQLAVGLERAI